MDSQQDFLRDAMRRLNLTRDAFAERLGVRRRTLDTWLLPEGSQEFRAMPEVVQRFVSEIAERQVDRAGYMPLGKGLCRAGIKDQYIGFGRACLEL